MLAATGAGFRARVGPNILIEKLDMKKTNRMTRSISSLLTALAVGVVLSCLPNAQAQLTIIWPPLSATNTVGDNVEFTVVATNASSPTDTLTYQWTNSEGAVIPSTSNTLVLLGVQTTSADTYTVVVTDTTASQTLTASATLAVNTTLNPAAGLVMWLPLNDGLTSYNTTTANDASGSGNSGSLQNFENDGFEWVTGGVSGGSLFYATTNGASNNVVVVNDAPSLTFTNTLHFSVAMWVNGAFWNNFQGSLFSAFLNTSQGGALMAKGYGNGGEQFDLDFSSGNFRFFIRDASKNTHGPTSSIALKTSGLWQHVVATYDGNVGNGQIYLYVNGAQAGATTNFGSTVGLLYVTNTGSQPYASVSVGNRYSSFTSGYALPFVGFIDDARIYNYALSASDASALYNSFSTYTATNLPDIDVLATENQPIFAGGNFPLYAFDSGFSAITYGWTFSGANTVSSPTTTSCTINSLTAGDNGTATLIVTNTQGTATNTVTINGIAPYPYAAAVMAQSPLAYWPLDETNNKPGGYPGATSVGYDYVKGNNAIVGGQATVGASGPGAPQYQGFPASHLAMGCVQTAVGFALPAPYGLNTKTPTYTAWIYTTANSQASSCGLIYSRQGSGAGGGMDYNGHLGYTWNNNNSSTYNWNSGLIPTNGVWTFVAIAIGNSSTIGYIGGANGILYSATNNVSSTETGTSSTAGLQFIGEDSNSGTVGTYNTGRIWNGSIADAAIFNTQLSLAQIQSLYYAAGIVPRFPNMLASTNLNQGATNTLTVTNIVGSLPMNYTWYYIDTNGMSNFLTSGALANYTGNTVSWTISNGQPSQSGVYYLSISNQFGTTISNTVVNIYGPPAITLGPIPANPTIYAGNNISFSVAVFGATPITNQWYTNGTPVPGATATNVTLTSVPLGIYTVTYDATNSVSNTVFSASASTTLTVVSPPNNAFPQAVLALNPVGYWRLNETEQGGGDDGVICHDYIGGNDGIYSNAILGNLGYDYADSAIPGYNYDPETSAGFGSYGSSSPNSCAFGIPNIDVSAPTNNSATFTVQAWVQCPNEIADTLNTPGVVGKGLYNNEEFTIDCGNHINGVDAYRFELRNAGASSYNANSTLIAGSDQKWHFLVGVCDQVHGNVTLYIDGTNAASVAIPPGVGIDPTDASVPMSIGARSSSATAGFDQQFSGYINDVAVFNYALTASQIQNEYLSAGIAPTVFLSSYTNTPYNNFIYINEFGTLTDTAYGYGSTNLSYQWYLTDTSNNTTAISGQTNAVLTLPDVQSWYSLISVVVTNGYGSVTSAVQSLLVQTEAAYIETDISPLNVDVPPGTMLSYSVVAYGALPIYYEWLLNGTVIQGATNSSYSFAAALGTNTYECAVSNSQSGSWYYGQTATVLAVNTPPEVGFDNGTGWSLQGTNYTPTISSGTLTMTTAAGNEATSAYYLTPQYISNGFVASFTYQPSGGTSPQADGIAFVVQNSSAGPTVIGTGGGGFGYFGVSPSVAFEMKLPTAASCGVSAPLPEQRQLSIHRLFCWAALLLNVSA